MIKVGIVTVWKNTSYGSKLQSYALQQKLNSLGYLGENIDAYQNVRELNLCYKLWRLIRNPSNVKVMLTRGKRHQRDAIFNNYMNEHINESKYSILQIKELIKEGKDPS